MIAVNAVKMAQQLLLPRVRTADLLIDATAGNGNDTLFLAVNSQLEAKIFAFDIQPAALEKTNELLASHNVAGKAQLLLTDHAHLAQYIDRQIDVAMFNLGYLPGQDHNITTKPASTLSALTAVLRLLSIGGVVSIVVYPGHLTGKLEAQLLLEFLPSLAQKVFSIGCWQMMNQIHNPPLLYIIERRDR
jgi:tRNA1(Val) A37 N6-methylase TrmN6